MGHFKDAQKITTGLECKSIFEGYFIDIQKKTTRSYNAILATAKMEIKRNVNLN